MLNKDEVKKLNRKNYDKKGIRTQNQFAKNQIVQTIEKPEINDSALEAKKND
jgi:hypothetical protein